MARRYWGLLTPWGPRAAMWDYGRPLVFLTRKEARLYANKKYGYIRERKDLRIAPHHWTMPKAVRVSVIVKVNQ